MIMEMLFSMVLLNTSSRRLLIRRASCCWSREERQTQTQTQTQTSRSSLPAMRSQGRYHGGRSSAQSQSFKTKAKNRLDDLQGAFCSLQQARKENRGGDVAMLEEQVNQMLREWKAELHEASPAASLAAASPSSSELSSDMQRLLQLTEEDDDATSNLAACLSKPVSDQQDHSPLAHCSTESVSVQEDYSSLYVGVQEKSIEEEMLERLLRVDIPAECSLLDNNPDLEEHLTGPALSSQDPLSHRFYTDTVGCSPNEPILSPPPAAFLGPKCALWDCPRPAAGSQLLQDYCSTFHATLAHIEGANGRSPVVRPGGIDLKDGPLFSSLYARSQNKAVGIPECEGAATSKSPWNAFELFDASMLQTEVIREWLFFDKPRRAFESGTRKQRSLPDHSGRGWHESRKQVMRDMGGLKRSYYMDPQPSPQLEWHLYEYELTNFDACALYRLELKQVNMNKKGNRSKAQHDPVVALQNQIGRLPANLSAQDGKVWASEIKPTVHKNKLKGSKFTQSSTFVSGQVKNIDANNPSSVAYAVEDLSNYLLDP